MFKCSLVTDFFTIIVFVIAGTGLNNYDSFGVDMSAFPIISRINATLSDLPEFKAAHPSQQIDCPADLR